MNHTTFEEIFAIMEASFPTSEIRTFKGQLELLKVPQYRLITKEDSAGKIIAFMACWEFPGFRFVEHIAVDPSIRGGGYGKKLMEDYISQSNKPVLLEVERPLGDIEQRRIGFYERLGFHLNPFEYVQPPLREGNADLPLLIMTYPNAIDVEDFHLYRDILYKEVYKVSASYPN